MAIYIASVVACLLFYAIGFPFRDLPGDVDVVGLTESLGTQAVPPDSKLSNLQSGAVTRKLLAEPVPR